METLIDPSFPKPTVELVLEAEKRFDLDDEVTERALTELFSHFPKNTDRSQILLKVAAINQLYSTNIYAVRTVANHIWKLNIDADLDAHSVDLVNRIARVRITENKEINFLSFASKYCNWHRPASYPIYDARAVECLWTHKLQFALSFARKDLWDYISYCDAVKDFRDRFELHSLTLKQIDKFLYRKGTTLLEARQQAKALAKQCAPYAS
ncbi:MAG: hypothetical protein ABSG03_28565 [Bryobacteraceae bacterium]